MLRQVTSAFLALAASAFAVDFTRIVDHRTVEQHGELPIAPFASTLTQKVPRSQHKAEALRQLQKRANRAKIATVAGSDGDEEYLTDITIGGQKFQAIIDTGRRVAISNARVFSGSSQGLTITCSSDTWLAKKGFKCFDLDSDPVSPSECAFGTSGFDTTKSKTFSPLPNTNFNISYGDGEFLTGDVGFETVSIGGLTVTHQEIGLVTDAAWNGDTITTGLIGLAYPGLTSVYNGTNPDDDSGSNVLQYSPLFFTAVKEMAVSHPCT